VNEDYNIRLTFVFSFRNRLPFLLTVLTAQLPLIIPAINFHRFPCSSNKAASSLSSLLVHFAREAEKVVEVALLVTSPAVFGSDTSVEETLFTTS